MLEAMTARVLQDETGIEGGFFRLNPVYARMNDSLPSVSLQRVWRTSFATRWRRSAYAKVKLSVSR